MYYLHKCTYFFHNIVNHYHVYENTGSKIHQTIQTVENRRIGMVHIIQNYCNIIIMWRLKNS